MSSKQRFRRTFRGYGAKPQSLVMKRSTDRILTSHAGSLHRPEDLRQTRAARQDGEPFDDALSARIKDAEIYGDAKEGKIVVVLETVRQKYITDIIETINNLEDVLNTSLVYHQIEHLGPSREEDL